MKKSSILLLISLLSFCAAIFVGVKFDNSALWVFVFLILSTIAIFAAQVYGAEGRGSDSN